MGQVLCGQSLPFLLSLRFSLLPRVMNETAFIMTHVCSLVCPSESPLLPCGRLQNHLEPLESDFIFNRVGSSILGDSKHVRDSSKLAGIQCSLLSQS